MMLNPALRRVLLADTTKLATHAAWLLRSSRTGVTASASLQQVIARIVLPCGATTARQTYATTTKPKAPRTKKTAASKKTKAKKKPKKKKKAATKKKKPAKRVKKPLSPEKQELARAKTLLAKALLDEPKRLATTAYSVYTTESRPTGPASLIELAREFKSIGPAELERLNHVAVENKEKNQAALRAFVEKHTPGEIRVANRARAAIKKMNADRKKNAKRSISGSKQKALYRLPDHRPEAKRPASAYIEFNRARWASGDFKNIALPEASSLIAREYKALSPSEREAYKK